MRAPSQPLKDSGDHPPGISYRVTCASNDGVTVNLSSKDVTVNAIFTEEKDAQYFVVGKDYVVFFASVGQ